MKTKISTPLITTIIPTYRRPILLKRAVQSILDQDFKDFKLIIYDDASNDETSDLCMDFTKIDKRVEYYRHSQNCGTINNHNFALKKIETPLFSFLSDDDFMLPNFFTDAVATLKQTPEAICFCGSTLYVDFEGNIVGNDLENWENGVYQPPNGLLEMIRKKHPAWQSTLFKKEVINDIGIFDSEILAMDYDYLLRVATHKTIVVNKKPYGVFQEYPHSTELRYNITQFTQGLLKVISNINLVNELAIYIKDEVEEAIMRTIHSSVFRDGLKAIGTDDKKNVQGAYDILNNLYKNTHKTRIFNLVYNLNILGKLLINLWRLFGPLRRYYHSNKNQRLYKKFEHLIPKNHTVRILKEWGHKVDS